jgi:hypothetical protein
MPVAVVAGAMVLAAGGQGAAADRSRYSLFNPTPDHLLRDMSTDRPDTTESPFTVDAGHFQVETNIIGYSRSRPDAAGAVSDTYELATTNLRIGLTNNFEAAVIWQPYGVVRTAAGGSAAVFRQAGIGALELRAKLNVWGNDTFGKSGSSALALLPFVSFPTDRGNGISQEFVEGGLIVPVAFKLSEKFGLGLNAGVVTVRDDPLSGYHAEYLGSASLSYEWNDKLGTYYEVAARWHLQDPRGDAVMLGTGVTYRLTKNVQLDAGVNVGVTPAADRINPFVGLSMRF